jgi:cell wall-associated NlpC family hydrolase
VRGKMGRNAVFIILCLAVVSFWTAPASARKSSHHAKYQRKKVVKTAGVEGPVSVKTTVRGREKIAIVNVPSSEVFSRNSERSERVTEVLLGDEFRVVREEDDWAYGYIPSQKGYPGWIRRNNITFSPDDSPFKDKPFVQVKNARARITLRDGSFINVYAGTRLPLQNREKRRYEVIIPDGSVGYLPLEAGWVESEHSEKDVTAEDILRASQFYGSDYKWGGITSGGMDCSGFVYTAFRLNGIFLRRDSYLQAEEGLDVPIAELNAGDLVFFKSAKSNRISHVGIYIGNGNFIHSSRGKKGVAVSSLSDEYFRKNFAGARRILHHFDDSVQMRKAKDQPVEQTNRNET